MSAGMDVFKRPRDFDDRALGVSLRPYEWEVLLALDGRTPLIQLLHRMGLAELNADDVADELAGKGLMLQCVVTFGEFMRERTPHEASAPAAPVSSPPPISFKEVAESRAQAASPASAPQAVPSAGVTTLPTASAPPPTSATKDVTPSSTAPSSTASAPAHAPSPSASTSAPLASAPAPSPSASVAAPSQSANAAPPAPATSAVTTPSPKLVGPTSVTALPPLPASPATTLPSSPSTSKPTIGPSVPPPAVAMKPPPAPAKKDADKPSISATIKAPPPRLSFSVKPEPGQRPGGSSAKPANATPQVAVGISGYKLKPLFDFIVDKAGGSALPRIAAQLAVYRVFRRVPRELMVADNIHSFSIGDPTIEVHNKQLYDAIVRAVEATFGVKYEASEADRAAG